MVVLSESLAEFCILESGFELGAAWRLGLGWVGLGLGLGRGMTRVGRDFLLFGTCIEFGAGWC